jgi:hypothetical protein
MNIFDFEDQEFGIKGVTQDEIDHLRCFCDDNGMIPYYSNNINDFKYSRNFSEEEWYKHTEKCQKLINQIFERIKYLPDIVESFDWWEMEPQQ